MAYTPKTWVCGETITDAGLNNIETGIQEALAGGGESLPEVTSADDDKVLTVVDGKWEKADRGYKCDGDDVETTECFEKAVESLLGYECKETYTLLTNETVTTTLGETNVGEGTLSYSPLISADTIKVTFNGTEYICNKVWNATLWADCYGAPYTGSGYDWSEYPFEITVTDANYILTEDAGTYDVKIEVPALSVTTTECFRKAVNNATSLNGTLTLGNTTLTEAQLQQLLALI